MKTWNYIRKAVFFMVMVAALVSLAGVALADDPCPEGYPHKGPFSYRNIVNATCTENGSQDKYCDACGKFVGTEPILPIGHMYETNTKIITAPTCLTAGLQQKSQICKVCGYNGGTTDETMPPLGHDWDSWKVTKAATCTEKGEETRICKRDASHIEKRDISALGHNYGAWTRTTEPKCETPGQDTRVCANDPAHKETRDVPAIGHKWDGGKVTKEPDCTYPGVRTFTCQNDPSHTRTESISVVPTAHKWDGGKITKAPTCAAPGEKTFTCQINPDHTRKETIPIDPNAHNWDNGTVTKEPTCEGTGIRTFVCKNDPSHTKTETIPATGHKWDKGVIIKQPTLTEEGKKLYTCQNDPSHTRVENLGVLVMSNNTVCAFGPRLRDVNLYPYNTSAWYMFTPFDASRDGRQTYELVASNMYIVGTLTIDIQNGQLIIDYKLADTSKFDITLEFFTVLSRIEDINRYEPEELLSLKMNTKQPISLDDHFGEDRQLVLYFCSRCDYTWSNRYTGLNYNSAAHQRLLSDMMALMD